MMKIRKKKKKNKLKSLKNKKKEKIIKMNKMIIFIVIQWLLHQITVFFQIEGLKTEKNLMKRNSFSS